MIDLSGIEYPLFAGLGAILGLVIDIPLAVIAIHWPEVWSYMWIAPVLGTVVGLIGAAFVK